MREREIPPAAMWGGIVVVVLIVVAVAYSLFLRPTAQIDPTKLTPQQLQDPDPPRVNNRPLAPSGEPSRQ